MRHAGAAGPRAASAPRRRAARAGLTAVAAVRRSLPSLPPRRGGARGHRHGHPATVPRPPAHGTPAPGRPPAGRRAAPRRSRPRDRARRRAAAARPRARTPCGPARRRTGRAPRAAPGPARTSPWVTAPIETSATIGLPSLDGIAIASGFVPVSGAPPAGMRQAAGRGGGQQPRPGRRRRAAAPSSRACRSGTSCEQTTRRERGGRRRELRRDDRGERQVAERAGAVPALVLRLRDDALRARRRVELRPRLEPLDPREPVARLAVRLGGEEVVGEGLDVGSARKPSAASRGRASSGRNRIRRRAGACS